MTERPSLHSRHNQKFDEFSDAIVTTDRKGEEIWCVECRGRTFLGIYFDWVEVRGQGNLRRVSEQMSANLNALTSRRALLTVREQRKKLL